MSLDYVARGEGIKASTVNSLIDAVQGGGNMSPDFLVTGTRTGPQIVASAQLGSSSLSRNCVFDVVNYTLSGWPMAKIQLGFELSDALNAVRVHTEDGIQTATSALVVFQNSSNCPFSGGNISGYILQSSNFGENAERGDTGWVKTKMEGVFGATTPNLQVWKTKDNVIEVIANINSDDAKSQVSSILSQNGMEESELSTMKFLEEWDLVNQTVKSNRPTSRTTMKNGIVDVYQYGKQPQGRAMLKAFLACYNAHQGEGEGRDSDWTWIIPMGSGADYKQDAEGVWSTQLTYGGDPIIVTAEPGTLDDNYEGDPIWIEESDICDNCIAFGKFHSDGGDKIEPGKVWLDIEYDYQKWAVVGTINDGSQDPPSDPAVLGHSIKIAESDEYKPKDDVKTGDEAQPQYVFNGTLGDLFKGEPKLDAYTPVQSGISFKSLNWTTRAKDSEGVNIGPVDCHCMQLYGFDNAVGVDPVTSSDLYLARRFNSDISSAELVYVPLSTFSMHPDSEISDCQMSSLQWRVLSVEVSSDEGGENETSGETSSEVKVLQAWNFDSLSDVYNDLCIALSGQSQHVMLRNASLSCIEYMQLSCLSVLCDSQGRTDQKSISWLSSDYIAPLELQLYDFDVAEGQTPDYENDMYLARRTTGTGPQLVYLPLSSQSTQGISPDSAVPEVQTSSLQWKMTHVSSENENNEEPEISGRTLQTWKFENFGEYYTYYKNALSSTDQHVLLRNPDLSCIEYISLSSMQMRLDSKGNSGQKSIGKISSEWDDGELQLYNFDQSSEEADIETTLTEENTSLAGSDYEFLMRKGGAGGELVYTNILAKVDLSSDSGGKVDDVSLSVYNNSRTGLQIEYVGNTPDKFVPLNFVEDVELTTYQSKPALAIEYSSGAPDKIIQLSGGGGAVDFTGTDSTQTNQGSSFTFASANDSNVVVNCNGTTITIGVYYV